MKMKIVPEEKIKFKTSELSTSLSRCTNLMMVENDNAVTIVPMIRL